MPPDALLKIMVEVFRSVNFSHRSGCQSIICQERFQAIFRLGKSETVHSGFGCLGVDVRDTPGVAEDFYLRKYGVVKKKNEYKKFVWHKWFLGA